MVALLLWSRLKYLNSRMKFYTDIHGSQMIISYVFVSPLTFPLAPPCGSHLWSNCSLLFWFALGSFVFLADEFVVLMTFSISLQLNTHYIEGTLY